MYVEKPDANGCECAVLCISMVVCCTGFGTMVNITLVKCYSRDSILHKFCTRKKMTLMKILQRRWGWVITLASFINLFIGFGTLYCYGLLYIALQNEFDSSNTSTAWIGSLAIAMSCFGTFLSSRLIQRYNNRVVALAGVLLMASGFIATSFMPLILPIYLSYGVLVGVGVNFILVSSMNLILKYFPEKNALRSTTFAIAGTTSGMLALNPVTHLVITNWGWRWMLRAMGAVSLLVGLPCVSTYTQPNSRNHTILYSKADNSKSPDDRDNEQSIELETKEAFIEKKQNVIQTNANLDIPVTEQFKILLYPELWFFTIAFTGTSTAQGFYYISFVSFMTTNDFEKKDAALVMTTIAVVELFGKFLLAAIGDNLPFPRIYLFHIASVMGIGVMATLFVVKEVWLMYCLAVVTGLLMTPFDSMIFSIGVEVFGPERNTEISAVLLIASGVGFPLGSLFGKMYNKCGIPCSLSFFSVTGLLMSPFDSMLYSIGIEVFGPERNNETTAALLIAIGIGFILGSLFEDT